MTASACPTLTEASEQSALFCRAEKYLIAPLLPAVFLERSTGKTRVNHALKRRKAQPELWLCFPDVLGLRSLSAQAPQSLAELEEERNCCEKWCQQRSYEKWSDRKWQLCSCSLLELVQKCGD